MVLPLLTPPRAPAASVSFLTVLARPPGPAVRQRLLVGSYINKPDHQPDQRQLQCHQRCNHECNGTIRALASQTADLFSSRAVPVQPSGVNNRGQLVLR